METSSYGMVKLRRRADISTLVSQAGTDAEQQGSGTNRIGQMIGCWRWIQIINWAARLIGSPVRTQVSQTEGPPPMYAVSKVQTAASYGATRDFRRSFCIEPRRKLRCNVTSSVDILIRLQRPAFTYQQSACLDVFVRPRRRLTTGKYHRNPIMVRGRNIVRAKRTSTLIRVILLFIGGLEKTLILTEGCRCRKTAAIWSEILSPARLLILAVKSRSLIHGNLMTRGVTLSVRPPQQIPTLAKGWRRRKTVADIWRKVLASGLKHQTRTYCRNAGILIRFTLSVRLEKTTSSLIEG